MSSDSEHDITDLLSRLRRGEAEAQGLLMESLYPAFKRMASRNLRQFGSQLTLSATELVHETYLRFEPQRRVSWENREQLIGVIGMLMRRAALDYLRGRRTEKRGAQQNLRSLDTLPTAELPGSEEDRELLDLESALRELAEKMPVIAAVAELKLFSGMTKDEIASSCNISTATVVRHWRFARAWLGERLGGLAAADDE
ncbi:ECF-type sigma factor [Pseudomarimonas arenosa]|uniref:Sigma-70 family RNA polymerase sigma factor n=1 Tax=Pseudomarimonas arenosa TaxID=2774145 RepID=A0AAW3ZIQ6_9GAMM|nr:ECF-type sigma factor [Pseudomarimonas arenosa]MBD8525963.1 sigma-70 family RNA polymerase sigma factor [Pseudomarimonas arenosa]